MQGVGKDVVPAGQPAVAAGGAVDDRPARRGSCGDRQAGSRPGRTFADRSATAGYCGRPMTDRVVRMRTGRCGSMWRYLSLALAACIGLFGNAYGQAVSKIKYQGETIRLSERYPDMGAYEEDPDNLPAEEIDRIAGLIKSAAIPQSFRTREQAGEYLYSKIKFPGYGLSLMQLDKPLALFSIEIPRKDESRWIAMEQQGGKWIVVDDFVWPTAKGYIKRAAVESSRIRYFDRDGKLLREK